MTTALFDTHKIVKELQEAGFDESQAEAVVAAIGTAVMGNVATKQDVMDARNEFKQGITDARNEFKQGITDVRQEVKDVRNELKQDIKDARNEAKQDNNELRAAMQAMELRITLRMGGMIVAGIGLMLALDRLL